MKTLGIILMFVGFITALGLVPAFTGFYFRKTPGFTAGMLIGAPIWLASAMLIGHVGGASGEATLGTDIGVPIGLFIGMTGGSLLGIAVSGSVGAFVGWLIK